MVKLGFGYPQDALKITMSTSLHLGPLHQVICNFLVPVQGKEYLLIPLTTLILPATNLYLNCLLPLSPTQGSALHLCTGPQASLH